jgi:hypothetical protein
MVDIAKDDRVLYVAGSCRNQAVTKYLVGKGVDPENVMVQFKKRINMNTSKSFDL